MDVEGQGFGVGVGVGGSGPAPPPTGTGMLVSTVPPPRSALSKAPSNELLSIPK
jgi:hypothetical protein